MSDLYTPVRAAMAAGTPHELICGTCPWDRLCFRPPEMTQADVSRQVEQAKATALAGGADKSQAFAVQLTAAAIFAGRDSAGVMCPVFADRLRSPDGRQLADAARALMRGESPP